MSNSITSLLILVTVANLFTHQMNFKKKAKFSNEFYLNRVILTMSKTNLHNSIACILILAQFGGVMPVYGITAIDVSYLEFKWCSFRTLYAIINLLGSITLGIMNFIRYINAGMHFGDIVSVVYYIGVVLSMTLFLKIARNWKKFSKHWYATDVAMRKYDYQPNLSKRLKITACIVMFSALGEHLLFISNLISILYHCKLFQSDPIKTYFGVAFAPIFTVTSFSYTKAFFIEFFNVLATFVWNFMDLFVMAICVSIREKFKQINKRVATTKLHDEAFWKEIREDYNKLAILCKVIDDEISHLVSLCLANDLFFICIQLFNTLKPLTGIVHSLYFISSFGFLLARTAAVSLFTASVNDESKVILVALFNVPSEDFGSEADRLIQQISCCPIAMTCSHYFDITRDLCLKVAGAVITFELILLQVGPMLFTIDSSDGDDPFCLE